MTLPQAFLAAQRQCYMCHRAGSGGPTEHHIVLTACDHVVCKPCLSAFVRSRVDVGDVSEDSLACTFDGCGKPLAERDIRVSSTSKLCATIVTDTPDALTERTHGLSTHGVPGKHG